MIDGPVDLDKIYNFTTFDITGDLTFAEPFGCLEQDAMHRWVSMVFEVSKAVTTVGSMMKLIPITPYLLSLVSKSFRKGEVYFRESTNAKLAKRLAMTSPRADFMTVSQKTVDTPEGMTLAELQATTAILIIAGSEITATILVGVTYYFLTNPSVHQKLIQEIRSTFHADEEITNASTQNLAYLHAERT